MILESLKPHRAGSLEREGSPEAQALLALQPIKGVDGGWGDLQGEVGTDVEDRQLCIDISIDNGEKIHPDEGESREIAITAIAVFAIFENRLKLLQTAVDVVGGWKEIAETIGERIIVHDIEIGLRIVHIHLLIPQESVGTS